MRRVFLKHTAISCAVATGLALVLALAIASPREALGALVGAIIASLDFIAIVWIVTGLLAAHTTAPSKAGLVVLMLGKLAFVGALLWSAIVRHGFDGVGLPLGIGAGLAGFTWGMLRAQSSPEGRAAVDAEMRALADAEAAAGRQE